MHSINGYAEPTIDSNGDDPMRICIVYLGRRGSGGPISLELALNLSAQADICAVISSYAENRNLWNQTGIPLIEVPTYRGKREAIKSLIYRRRIQTAASRISDWGPDVLVYPMFHLWTPFLQRHLAAIPGILFVHDPAPHPGLAHYLNSIMENRLIPQITRFVLFSDDLRDDLMNRGVSDTSIDVIPHGELSYYRRHYPLSSKASRSSTHIVLLFFGRITRYKGLEILLKAFKEIRRRYRVRLLVAGDGNLQPYSSLLQGLEDVVIINRWIKDHEIPELFAQADMAILPYTSASQSGVLALAASFELPVVATRTGGLAAQISAGRTGLLVEPGSVDQLIRAIEQLLNDPCSAKEMGKRLSLDFSQNRNWPAISNDVYGICEKAIHDASRL